MARLDTLTASGFGMATIVLNLFKGDDSEENRDRGKLGLVLTFCSFESDFRRSEKRRYKGAAGGARALGYFTTRMVPG